MQLWIAKLENMFSLAFSFYHFINWEEKGGRPVGNGATKLTYKINS